MRSISVRFVSLTLAFIGSVALADGNAGWPKLADGNAGWPKLADGNAGWPKLQPAVQG